MHLKAGMQPFPPKPCFFEIFTWHGRSMDACSFSENCLKKFQGQVEKKKFKDGQMYTNLMVGGTLNAVFSALRVAPFQRL